MIEQKDIFNCLGKIVMKLRIEVLSCFDEFNIERNDM